MVSDNFKEVSRAKGGSGVAGNEFSRDELVAELKHRYAADGYAGIADLLDRMLTDGQVHEPEWITCQDCDTEIERDATKAVRCDPCRQIHHNTLDRNRKSAKRDRREKQDDPN